MVPSKLVFATLVCFGRYQDPGTYLAMTENWVRQLQYYGVPLEQQLLIVTTDLESKYVERARRLGTKMLLKEPLKTKKGRWEDQATKLHLWNLTMYDRIVYYDSDFIFKQSPLKCLAQCSPSATLCAVADNKRPVPWKNFWFVRKWRYFNAGFMVIKPSSAEFEWLHKHVESARRMSYAEQDYLNARFDTGVQYISPMCNILQPGEKDFTNPNAIALHAKIWDVESMVWISPHIRARVRLVPQFGNLNPTTAVGGTEQYYGIFCIFIGVLFCAASFFA